jgi:hypothetical protein
MINPTPFAAADLVEQLHIADGAMKLVTNALGIAHHRAEALNDDGRPDDFYDALKDVESQAALLAQRITVLHGAADVAHMRALTDRQ